MGSETHAPPAEIGTVSGNGAAAAEPDTERSRRALLRGLGVAAAGAVVGSVLSPEEAEANHGFLNANSNTPFPAIHGSNTDVGDGVIGTSTGGTGVRGISDNDIGVDGRGANKGVDGSSDSGIGVAGSSDSGDGVDASSSSGRGVIATSIDGTGVEARSDSGPGVEGHSKSGIGVTGASESLIGVEGTSPNGIGVEGFSPNGIGVDGNGGNVGVVGSSESGTAVFAQTTNGLALNVVGPARFSTAGAGNIPAQQSSVVVNDPAVTADSHITMTLTGNPGSVGSGLPAVVVWIERQPGTGFIARLSRKVTNATPFTYLIVEPG